MDQGQWALASVLLVLLGFGLGLLVAGWLWERDLRQALLDSQPVDELGQRVPSELLPRR